MKAKFTNRWFMLALLLSYWHMTRSSAFTLVTVSEWFVTVTIAAGLWTYSDRPTESE